jgi:hypothetical protein
MKKLLYLVLTVLIVSCSSDDLNPVPACWENPSFEGTWVGMDGETTLTYVFDSNGTGSLATSAVDDSETFTTLNWLDERGYSVVTDSASAFNTGTLTISGTINEAYIYSFDFCKVFTMYNASGTESSITYSQE